MAHFKVSEFNNHLELSFSAPGNALSLSVARELASVQKKYKKWTKPVVVASTHPSLFCSGGNLSDYKKLKDKASGLKINREIQKHLDGFGAWPVVKLAVIEGDVLGGGLEWLARFDFRWSTPHVFFSFWQRRIGLSPGWGGGKIWAARIGEEKLRQVMLEAEIFSAGTALRWGLVDRLHSTWKIREEVNEWAQVMCEPTVRGLLKWKSSKEAATFQKLWMGPEHRAALKRWV
jgi:enoyl-CoA hydratase/carnithine racemase